MSYATLMVHVDDGEGTGARLNLAYKLAEAHQARLIGVCSLLPAMQPSDRAGKPGIGLEAPVRHEAAERTIGCAEALFRTMGRAHKASIEWRWALHSPADFVVRECRAADLVIIGGRAAQVTAHTAPNPSDIVLGAGRPVLLIPQDKRPPVPFRRVMIAWKDVREARRAVADALPFLKAASHVAIVQVAEANSLYDAQSSVDDVARHLQEHGVHAAAVVLEAEEGAVHDRLLSYVREREIDLVVMGAYGHSRMREWVFGGVTRGMLRANAVCCLLSH